MASLNTIPNSDTLYFNSHSIRSIHTYVNKTRVFFFHENYTPVAINRL